MQCRGIRAHRGDRPHRHGWRRPYNQRLSERRARAVEDALVADGVPKDTIAARGVGKTDLMVPTADWRVREPKNRRVEIVEEEARVD